MHMSSAAIIELQRCQVHGHRLDVLGYGDVRCAAIHSHRRPLEMGIGKKDASPCAHARPRP